MCRLRLLGRVERLDEALSALQDLEVVHVAAPRRGPGVEPLPDAPERAAERERLEALVADLDALLAALPPRREARFEGAVDLGEWSGRARALRAEAEGLVEAGRALDEERVLLERFRDVVSGFAPLLGRAEADPSLRARYLVLKADPAPIVEELRRVLDGVDVLVHPLGGGEAALALLVPQDAAPRVDAILAAAALDDLPAPEAYGGGSLIAALPRMLDRLAGIPAERGAIDEARRALGEARGDEAAAARGAAHDRLAALAALGLAAGTGRAFVIEGWVPEVEAARVTAEVERRLGPEVAVERVACEDWGEAAPVVLRNPPLFRPFEAVTALVPLPKYGSIDPTPFVAVSFPMLFGLILGDVGYGAILAVLAGLLRRRAAPGSTGRAMGTIGLACALFTVIFGALYGELFGDLGHLWWGWEPLLLNREEALVPALVLALGVGVVHLFLGLVVGAIASARGHPREALGRGLGAFMLLCVALAALAVAEVLPGAVFTPLIVAAVLAFPLMVVAEGILAPVEVMSTFAHVLSYARIMAVGTASVMMAVVANRVAGAMGSVLVGFLFALLFHVVNFAIGVFGPAVHVLRLHYVEFFGEFYSPGGTPYRPLVRWHPGPGSP